MVDFAAALQQQAKLLDLSLEPILVWELGGAISYWNAGAESLYGYSATEAIGRRSHELLATVCLASDPDFEAAVARDGRWMGELAHTTRDGLRVIVESLQELLPQPHGRRPLVLETNRDVTARKEAERQLRDAKEVAERANASKSRFLAAASHDLRQPLQAIDLQRAILARIATAPAAVRAIENLGSSIDTMRNALDSLLDLSQLETGAIQAEPVEFALNDLLQAITREFDGLASSKGLQLRAPTTTALVRTDRRLLERVLQNLVANAIKYTDDGRVLIGCRRRQHRVSIQVWDTGIGIAADKLEPIFDEFFQVANAARERRLGLGLGLSIARAAADLVGSRLEVCSVPGKGSVFSVAVPCVGVARPPALIVRPPVPSHPPSEFARVILVIEDDEPIRDALSSLLNLDDYGVAAFATGDAALAAVVHGSCNPALIIADQNLAGELSGTKTIELVRRHLQPRHVPALVITGDVLPERLAGIRDAALPCVTKPVNVDELQMIVRTLLGDRPIAANATAALQSAEERRPRGPTVLIVEDDVQQANALRSYLISAGLSAQVHTSAETLLQVFRAGLDGCALIDINLPGMSGLDLQRELTRRDASFPCVLLTGGSEVGQVIRAMRDNAVDFLVKPIQSEALLASVTRALEVGRKRRANSPIPVGVDTARMDQLTRRERDVVALIADGLSNKEVAGRLAISQRTVEGHRARAMHKLEVRTPAELVRLLLAQGSGHGIAADSSSATTDATPPDPAN